MFLTFIASKLLMMVFINIFSDAQNFPF